MSSVVGSLATGYIYPIMLSVARSFLIGIEGRHLISPSFFIIIAWMSLRYKDKSFVIASLSILFFAIEDVIDPLQSTCP